MIAVLLALLSLSPARASALDPQVEQLWVAVHQQCKLPETLHPSSEGALKIFLSQLVIPDNRMPNGAFLEEFRWPSPESAAQGYCVIVFLGLPNDPAWERDLRFQEEARKAEALPAYVQAGFDGKGNLLLAPLGAARN